MNEPTPPRDLSSLLPTRVAYSFGTLATNLDEYRAMIAAFRDVGFTADDCEFLYVDNSIENRFDAFVAYNRFLQQAQGRYIVLCHQDILPLEDGRVRLDALLTELDALDQHWGICGNAGAKADGELVFRLTHGKRHQLTEGGPFPAKVISLDENFIVVRRDANLALSRDLSGFHWYGADLCLVADVLGWNAYVIDFHLFHKSTGKLSDDFFGKGQALRKKYARAFRSRWQFVPMSQPVFVSGSPLRTFVARAVHKLRRLLGTGARYLRPDSKAR
jgi:hypothetical protein